MNFFSQDGWLFTVITKTGEIILATLLFLVCCLPLVTIVSSASSFYYVMMKCVRRERGYITREFFSSMKRTLFKGAAITIAIALFAYGLWYNRNLLIYAHIAEGELHPLLILIDIAAVFLCFITVWIAPVLSRFDNRLIELIRLASYISVRYFYLTIALIFIIALGVFATIRVLPVLFTIIVPGIVCFASTFIAEKALLSVMPGQDDNIDQWYRS